MSSGSTRAASLPATGNDGVIVQSSTPSSPASGNTIGGTTAAARNVISGNLRYGVDLFGAGVSGNVVEGNYIGTDVAGTTARGNVDNGIVITDALGNTIGGTVAGAGNVISGNTFNGVNILSAPAPTGNVVEGNLIGTDGSGVLPLPNADSGVYIDNAPGNTIGGTTALARNVISGNGDQGVHIIGAGATGNLIEGNYVGVDASGEGALGNANTDVFLDGASGNTIGGTTAGARNVISGSGFRGIRLLSGSANLIEGNYIGTDALGIVAIANQDGIELDTGSTGNTIGGSAPGAGNLISGNASHGIDIADATSNNNTIAGNLIGTDKTGLVALANGGDGIGVGGASGIIIGGTTAAARNVISGNLGRGVDLAGPSNFVLGNYIGVDITGNAAARQPEPGGRGRRHAGQRHRRDDGRRLGPPGAPGPGRATSSRGNVDQGIPLQ